VIDRLRRWLVIDSVPASTAGGIAMDADEWVAEYCFTRLGAWKLARRWRCRVVRRRDWDNRL